nr:MAG TPA: hypothetical protein [Bacteriophage sp.]
MQAQLVKRLFQIRLLLFAFLLVLILKISIYLD